MHMDIHIHMRIFLFILFCFHPKFSWSFVCCCFNGGTKQRNKKNTEAQIVRFYKNNNRFLLERSFQHRLKHASQLHQTHTLTLTHTHTNRRFKCCSEMETGRHNTGTGYGFQNKNRENWIYTTNYALYCMCVKYTHTRIEVFSSSGIFQLFSSFNPLIFGCATCCLRKRRGRGKSFTSSPTLTALTRVLYSYLCVEVIASFGSPTPNPDLHFKLILPQTLLWLCKSQTHTHTHIQKEVHTLAALQTDAAARQINKTNLWLMFCCCLLSSIIYHCTLPRVALNLLTPKRELFVHMSLSLVNSFNRFPVWAGD